MEMISDISDTIKYETNTNAQKDTKYSKKILNSMNSHTHKTSTHIPLIIPIQNPQIFMNQ